MEQSSKNWQKVGDDCVQCCLTIDLVIWERFMQYFSVKLYSFCLVGCRATQVASMCKMSSVTLQDSERRQVPVTFLDQCEQSFSVLYLPEIILAWTVAMANLAGEDPAVHQIGWGLVSDM